METIDPDGASTIPESFFELRQIYAKSWPQIWALSPHPFLAAILPIAESNGVELADISFNANPSNLAEVSLNALFRKCRAAVKITLNSATFLAENPSWEEAPQLIELFQLLADAIASVGGISPKTQESSLSLQLTPGTINFGKLTAGFVRTEIVGAANFFGITRHRSDSSLTIDRSAKYPDGAFVRLQRTHPGDRTVSDIAKALLEDEMEALNLLGIYTLPERQSI